MQPPCIHACRAWRVLTTGKALSQNRQENSGKPGYNLALKEPKRFPPGHRALSYWDNPKTGRENYIRENVYVAHLPLTFLQMSDYSSPQPLRRGLVGDGVRGTLSVISLWKGSLLAEFTSMSEHGLSLWHGSDVWSVSCLRKHNFNTTHDEKLCLL